MIFIQYLPRTFENGQFCYGLLSEISIWVFPIIADQMPTQMQTAGFYEKHRHIIINTTTTAPYMGLYGDLMQYISTLRNMYIHSYVFS